MIQYSFSPEGRTAFRRAILDNPQWDTWRKANGKDASNLTIADMLSAAAAMGIDPAAYGKAKGEIGPAREDRLSIDASIVTNMVLRKAALQGELEKRNLSYNWFTFNSIVSTIQGQAGKATARQYAVLESIVERAQRKLDTLGDYAGNPPPEPLPLPGRAMPAPDKTPAPDHGDDMTTDAKTAALEAKLKAMRDLLGGDGIDEGRVIELIKQHAGKPAHVTIDLRTPHEIKPLGETLAHYCLPLLLSAVQSNVPVMLVGPAGSGKTSAAAQVAKMMGLPFYFTGAIDSPYKLTGFIDAQGRVTETAFRKAFISGGVFLFDEMDASAPGALLAFNSATANDFFDFPDGIFPKHPDFRVIASANTFGRGADRQYVGRMQQDAAVLDRYAVLAWDYDPALESAMLGMGRPEGAPDPIAIVRIEDTKAAQREAHRWLDRVRQVRAKVEQHKVRHVVSPRASIMGARLLAAGWPWAQVETSILFKGLDADTMAKVA